MTSAPCFRGKGIPRIHYQRPNFHEQQSHNTHAKENPQHGEQARFWSRLAGHVSEAHLGSRKKKKKKKMKKEERSKWRAYTGEK
jgi:hypothetical protein